MTLTRYRGSLDFITIDITGPSAPQVDTDTIKVCFSKSLSIPIDPVWYTATNNADGTATILEGPPDTGTPALVTTLTAGCWHIMMWVVDDPSQPIFYAGDIYILD